MAGAEETTDKASALTIDLDALLSNSQPFVAAKIMADPFEVRMRFTAQLQHLNASVTSSQKAAQYAIKYKDMDEDLHSCILEQLEKVRIVVGHETLLKAEAHFFD